MTTPSIKTLPVQGTPTATALKFAWHRSLLWHSLVLFLLVNPLFWVASIWVDFERAWINLDYLFVLLLAMGRGHLRLIAIFAFIVALAFDCLAVLSSIFTLMTIHDLVYMVRFIDFTNVYPGYWMIAGIALLFILIMIPVCYRVAQRLQSSDWLTLCISLMLLAAVDRLIHLSQTYHTYTEWISYQSNTLFDSQSVLLIKQKHATGFGRLMATEADTGHLKTWDQPTASNAWFNAANDSNTEALPNLMLIVVESWGLANDSNLNGKLYPDIEKLKYLPQVDVINNGMIAYDGPTIRGEVRELCQAVPNTMRVQGTDISSWPCLPRLLVQKGYHTWSVNVASRSMYDAALWYPMTGIQHPLFLEDNIQNLGRCYSWPGGCDDQYFPIIQTQIFKNEGKHFVYWLTANSHFPYDARDAIKTDYQCESDPRVTGTLCDYAKIHSRFFIALTQFLQQQTKAVEVILVGDHHPPFADKSIEARFDHKHVPFLHFRWQPKRSEGVENERF